jgi:hypothetical protein
MVQDVVRYGWFSARRPWKAALVDTIWLLASVAGYGLAIAADWGTTGLAAAWACGGALAGLVGVVQLRIDLRIGRPVAWVREHWVLCRNFFGEALMFASVQLGLAELLRVVGGLEDVGTVRLAVALTGPLRVVIVGAGVALLPEAIRRRRSGTEALVRFGARISIGLAVVAAVWTIALQLVPDSIGDSLLGASWDGGQRMALPTGLSFVAIALGAGSLVGIRAHRPELSYRGTAAVAGLSAAGFCAGLLIFDAFGALVGHAIGTALGVAFAWSVLVHALRDYPVEAEDELAAAVAAEVELRGPLSA